MSEPIYSMTGYATVQAEASDTISLTLTIKSVNHRFFDLQLRLPNGSDALEAQLRKLLKQHIQRGHVEFTVQLDRQSRTGLAINQDQLRAYIETFRQAALTHNLSSEPDLNEVLRLPGMMSAQQAASPDDALQLDTAVMAALPGLITAFNASRANEGASLATELQASMTRLDGLAGEVSSLREGVRSSSFERLRERIAELTAGASLNEDRLLAEAALIADKSDVEEELVRLRTHAASFASMLEQGGLLGKRLDFLLQELNREANTLLSKTGGAASQNGLRITELGLAMKVEIERAREQIQNIE